MNAQVHEAQVKALWAASEDLFFPFTEVQQEDAPAYASPSPTASGPSLPGSGLKTPAPDTGIFPRGTPSNAPAGSSEARFKVDPRELSYEAAQTKEPFSDGPGAPSPAVLAAMRRQLHQERHSTPLQTGPGAWARSKCAPFLS